MNSSTNPIYVEFAFISLIMPITLEEAIKQLVPISGQLWKKYAAQLKKQGKFVVAKKIYKLPIDLINNNEFSPIYFGKNDSIKVVLDNKDLLALDVPAGIHSASLHYNEQNTVFNWLRVHQRQDVLQIQQQRFNRNRGLINRLDFQTSGLLIFAKSNELYDYIREHFQDVCVEKKYFCIVQGKLVGTGVLENTLVPIDLKGKKMKVLDENKNNAKLSYEALEYNESHDITLTQIQLFTGLRHQIRAQLAHFQYPLLGDNLYNPRPNSSLNKFYLHAFEYKIRLPHETYLCRTSLPSWRNNFSSFNPFFETGR